jgi:transcriptional regulator with XRE-family HTH domain
MAGIITNQIASLDGRLKALGENLRLARLRRNITAEMLAQRAGMTRNTLRSIERGEGGVTLRAYASVLFCLGLEKDLELIAKDDEFGRKLQDSGLVNARRKRTKPSTKSV